MKVFLTGASGGIGKIIFETLIKNDIDVIAPKSSELDLNLPISVEEYHEFDGFIHCAGINPIATAKQVLKSDIIESYTINTLSFVELCSKLKLKNKSNIIAIGSIYSIMTNQGRISYAMSKHALLGAVKTLALELAKNKIKVNMISPGFVDTQLTRKNNTEERISMLDQTIPLGLVDAKEIANMCLYLIQNNNSITGQNIIIDGGYSIKGI